MWVRHGCAGRHLVGAWTATRAWTSAHGPAVVLRLRRTYRGEGAAASSRVDRFRRLRRPLRHRRYQGGRLARRRRERGLRRSLHPVPDGGQLTDPGAAAPGATPPTPGRRRPGPRQRARPLRRPTGPSRPPQPRTSAAMDPFPITRRRLLVVQDSRDPVLDRVREDSSLADGDDAVEPGVPRIVRLERRPLIGNDGVGRLDVRGWPDPWGRSRHRRAVRSPLPCVTRRPAASARSCRWWCRGRWPCVRRPGCPSVRRPPGLLPP